MHTKIHKFFNAPTRQAMFEGVGSYLDASHDADPARLGPLGPANATYRFDLGENAEGYSPRIREYLTELAQDDFMRARFNHYPERNHTTLKLRIAEKFSIPPEWIVLGAGLDSILDLIARVFLEHRDIYLMPTPSFFLFEAISERMGAVPYFLDLKEEDAFRWTADTTRRFRRMVEKFRPKLIWIANPNNPTGHYLNDMTIEELVAFASSYNAFVVVDEAYGEYTDPPGEVLSAARLLARHPNLMVLRTFSKKYGLASLRVGYLMCAASRIREGLQVHQPPFPITQLSADLALIALEDDAFLQTTREQTLLNRKALFEQIQRMDRFTLIPSSTNIFMLRHKDMDGPTLRSELRRRGIIASPLEITGLEGKGYLRFCLRKREDNHRLCQALWDLNGGRPGPWPAPPLQAGLPRPWPFH